MKITNVEVHILQAPDTGRPHWVSHFIVPRANEILVKLRTDSGISDQIMGADPLATEKLFQTLFNLTHSRLAHEKGWGKEALMRIAAAVDIACWDILGKHANLPLYKLFGGFRDSIPCYVTCAYYREGKDLLELRDEIQMLKEQGHRGFKGKVGGVSLAEDIERMALIREIIGDDCDLMVDVNRGWDLRTAIEGAKLLEPLRPRWLEEPVRWADDRRELKLLSQKTSIPLSAGESELTSWGCRSLIDEQSIDILQFDCTMTGGFTEGRKLSALCELNHVQVAPHHDCFIHAHIVAGSPAGCIVESFTDPERDPLQAELYENPPAIKEGVLTLNEEPGLGLRLSEEAVAKFGTRVL
jgi:L-alanine-DL-glutamate epimerase-like enolase superfamily enzyme